MGQRAAAHLSAASSRRLALVFGSSFVFGELLPGLFQRFFVKPSELQLEAPYIQRNIALTQEAYNLRHITVKPFPAEQGLTFQSLEDNRATIDNIRLWDWQPLMDTYAQLQEIRTYYRFLDVDIDRYEIGGSYQQVTLSARELDALAAVRQRPDLGQPAPAVHPRQRGGDVPGDAEIRRGSAESSICRTSRRSHPAAPRSPSHASISARRRRLRDRQRQHAGVRLSQGQGQRLRELRWRRRRPDRRRWAGGRCSPGTSTTSTSCSAATSPSESRILLHRNIQDRVETIAPFLRLDHDPYVVISDGRLYWIQDAYTTSDWFPYAQPQPDGGDSTISAIP